MVHTITTPKYLNIIDIPSSDITATTFTLEIEKRLSPPIVCRMSQNTMLVVVKSFLVVSLRLSCCSRLFLVCVVSVDRIIVTPPKYRSGTIVSLGCYFRAQSTRYRKRPLKETFWKVTIRIDKSHSLQNKDPNVE
jgi:hypothetical protein